MIVPPWPGSDVRNDDTLFHWCPFTHPLTGTHPHCDLSNALRSEVDAASHTRQAFGGIGRVRPQVRPQVICLPRSGRHDKQETSTPGMIASPSLNRGTIALLYLAHEAFRSGAHPLLEGGACKD
eukprot:scaffold121940_cov31-Tisochrysis_lutea.AAC.2